MSLINKSDKIFVAGHNGMAGSAICRSLKRFGFCNEKNKGKLLQVSRKDLDLSNTLEVHDWFIKNKPDVVVLAAAKVGGIEANRKYPADFILENLKIQTNVIEQSWKSGVKRLLFLGSSCIYPKFSKQPIVEEELLKGELESTNAAYGIAKITGIKLCNSLREQYNFDAINLMPTNLYGPNDNYNYETSHVLPSLIRKFYEAKLNNKKEVICWGSGNALREFLHSDDLGDACVFALENWDPSNQGAPKDNKGNLLNTLNVGSGREVSIKNLTEIIAKSVGYQGEIKWDMDMPDGTPRKLLDHTRLRDLGWVSSITLEDGISLTLSNFEDQYNANKLRL